jgi:hypothetical protein
MLLGVPSIEDAMRAALMFGLVPLWAAAGVGDWLCHRLQHIELSAGVGESLLHLLMLGILGPATLAVLYFEVNARLLPLLLLACVAHEAVFWWDLAYASRRRVIPPIEQWVHAVQFAAPWVGFAALAVLHRDQLFALLGTQGAPVADWAWRQKTQPLPADYIVVVLALGTTVVCLPFLEELWRCLRVRRHPLRTAWRP